MGSYLAKNTKNLSPTALDQINGKNCRPVKPPGKSDVCKERACHESLWLQSKADFFLNNCQSENNPEYNDVLILQSVIIESIHCL
jgi:hypothetical protein